MPELPEVETVCRTMRACLGGKVLVSAEVVPDEIVLEGRPIEAYTAALVGATVTGVGRHGKYWWIETDRKPWVFGHLGMAGWIRRLPRAGESIDQETRLREHGKMAFEDSTGRPRFLKLLLEAEDGERIAFTDGRRLARLWLGNTPADDSRIQKLGPDVRDALPCPAQLHQVLSKRSAPIKSLLLDQTLFAGVGNWIADEVLFQARISPHRSANDLSLADIKRLCSVLSEILEQAVAVSADSEKFPPTWLFHHRWGGKKGTDSIGGSKIVRDTVGGRTTAWVPGHQK